MAESAVGTPEYVIRHAKLSRHKHKRLSATYWGIREPYQALTAAIEDSQRYSDFILLRRSLGVPRDLCGTPVVYVKVKGEQEATIIPATDTDAVSRFNSAIADVGNKLSKNMRAAAHVVTMQPINIDGRASGHSTVYAMDRPGILETTKKGVKRFILSHSLV